MGNYNKTLNQKRVALVWEARVGSATSSMIISDSCIFLRMLPLASSSVSFLLR